MTNLTKKNKQLMNESNLQRLDVLRKRSSVVVSTFMCLQHNLLIIQVTF